MNTLSKSVIQIQNEKSKKQNSSINTYKDNSFTGKDWNEFLVYRKNKKIQRFL